MKTMKKVLIGILAVPLFLILFEIFGMIINHASTGIQTNRLRHDIADAIPNTEIISVESQTGNTTGTGNHVDCLTQSLLHQIFLCLMCVINWMTLMNGTI